MRTLKNAYLLEFYDIPLVWYCENDYGEKFLCYVYDDFDDCQYIGIKISQKNFERYIDGKVDLLSILERPENNHYYKIITHDFKKISAKRIYKKLGTQWLPYSGFYNEEKPMKMTDFEAQFTNK